MAANTLSADVTAALDRLAEHGSPDEIAEHLKQVGVTGTPGCCHECVLAEYLKAEIAGLIEVTVTDLIKVTIDDYGRVFFETEDEPDGTAPIPGRLTDFALRFDTWSYPALITPGRG